MHCILERREHTAVANTHVEDLCVGGVAARVGGVGLVGCGLGLAAYKASPGRIRPKVGFFF